MFSLIFQSATAEKKEISENTNCCCVGFLFSPLLSVSTDSEIEQESVMEIDIDTILPRPPIK